jgi:hypothetical protein
MIFLQKEPTHKPIREAIPRDLATPAAGCVWEVPVAIVLYAPTRDGVTVDADATASRGSVKSLRERVLRQVRLHKWMMEEGSRFRGYRDRAARPSLGYRCVHYTTFLEDIPPRSGEGVVFPDYAGIVERVGGRDLVNDRGVKEFWIYHWHHGRIAPIETNLASPVSPDISNSHRTDDLPIYKKTYMVISANFNRGPDKTVHNMGHQMEAVLTEMSRR